MFFIKMFFLFFSVLFTSLSSCLVQANQIDKIIGVNEMVIVKADSSNVPLRYRGLVDAFGKLTMGCTATHIGNGYVLTAGHCFWAPPQVERDLNCDDQKIEWGLRDGKEPYMVSQCEKVLIEQQDEQNDYAILKVSPIPPIAIAPDMNRRAIIGDTLTVFSHPKELALHWSGTCGVERVNHPELPDKTLKHKCDTHIGSSGAVLINSISLKIVGIHDGGVDGFKFNDDPNLEPKNTGLNYGTFIMNSPLYDALIELGFK